VKPRRPRRIEFVISTGGIESGYSETKINWKVPQRRGPKSAPKHDELIRRIIALGDELHAQPRKYWIEKWGANERAFYRALRAVKISNK
jgi:hypothetical protein